jgi:hypothetical protein
MLTTAYSNAGTVKYLPSAGLMIVDYPATAHPDREFTIDPVTGDGTLRDVVTGDQVIDNATISLTWDHETKTKRASASHPLRGVESNLSQDYRLSTDYPGQIFAFEVPDPGNPGKKRVAVGCGVTPIGNGVSRASMTVVTKDYLGGHPVREAENAPITNYRAPQAAIGASEEMGFYCQGNDLSFDVMALDGVCSCDHAYIRGLTALCP